MIRLFGWFRLTMWAIIAMLLVGVIAGCTTAPHPCWTKLATDAPPDTLTSGALVLTVTVSAWRGWASCPSAETLAQTYHGQPYIVRYAHP